MSQNNNYDYIPFNRPEEPEGSASLKEMDVQATYYLKLGNSHYNTFLSKCTKTDLDTAITHYKKALEIDPNLSEGYVKLASALWDKGEIPLETAIEYCQQSIKLNSTNSDANLFLGYFLRKAGKVEEAIREFKTAVKKAKPTASKPRIALGVGLIQLAAGENDLKPLERVRLTCEGLTYFAMGCMLLPIDIRSVHLLTSALIKDFQVYSLLCIGKMCQWVGLGFVTARVYRWATEQMPGESLFYQLLADLYSDKGKFQEGVHHYQRALELEPTNPQLHKKLGVHYYNGKELDSAAECLEKALEYDTNDFDTLYHLGRIYSEQKEYIRSLYYFKESFNRDPHNPYIHSHMAYLLFKLEDFDGAIQEYRLAVSYGEDDAWTSTVAQTLGVLYYQVKQDLDAAVAMFQLAFQLNPSNLDSMAMLADLYFEQGNLESAIGAYKHILTYEPENAECYSYLGYLLWQMDKNDEAIEAYQTAIKFDQKNYISYNNLGVIYLDELSNNPKAMELFKKALSLKPDYTLACFNLGRTLEAMGQSVQAANIYSDSLSMNAENPELEDKEIMDRLDGLFKTA